MPACEFRPIGGAEESVSITAVHIQLHYRVWSLRRWWCLGFWLREAAFGAGDDATAVATFQALLNEADRSKIFFLLFSKNISCFFSFEISFYFCFWNFFEIFFKLFFLFFLMSKIEFLKFFFTGRLRSGGGSVDIQHDNTAVRQRFQRHDSRGPPPTQCE